MNTMLIKKWFFRSTLVLLFISILGLVWVDYEINHLWGQHTKVVDYTKFNSPQESIAITNVNILSPDGREMIGDQVVVISQGKITSIDSDTHLPSTYKIIDGKNKYLIPGLIDSHVHLWKSPNDLLLYIANGVTHIRELNGSDEHLQWKQQIKDGRIGPTMFVASSRINSSGIVQSWFQKWAMKITSINAFNSAESTVQNFADKGYDAIKTYTFINNEDYLALGVAAKKIGLPLLGHTPIAMGLDEVWKSNQKELAHIEELVKALGREFGGYNEKNAEQFLQFVQKRSAEIASNLVKNKIAVVTTLWLTENFSKQKDDLNKILQKVQVAYVNPGITEKSPITSRAMGWLADSNIYRFSPEITPEKKARYLIYWQTYVKAHQILLKVMADKGVILLAGTDANVPVAVPGFSLHDELISLTKSGMPPSQALASATAIPADWMKVKTGRVVIGYKADLILLNKNPLDKIENTQSIQTVIVNGRIFNRELLDKMLSEVKKANDQSRSVDISSFEN